MRVFSRYAKMMAEGAPGAEAEARPCVVAAAIADPNAVMFDIRKTREQAVAHFVKATQSFPDRPVGLAAWSNGGAYCVWGVSQAAEEAKAKNPEDRTELDEALIAGYNRLAGVMMDSAPSFAQPWHPARAVVAHMPRSPIRDIVYIVALLFFSMWYALATIGLAPATIHYFTDWWNSFNPDVPFHFIFSDTDEITPVTPLAASIEHKRDLGLSIKVARLRESAHVDHLRSDADLYHSLANSFITSLRFS